MKKYILMEGNFPSLYHGRYDTYAEAQAEADRINSIHKERNKEIDRNLLERKGSVFMNLKYKYIWTVKEIDVSE